MRFDRDRQMAGWIAIVMPLFWALGIGALFAGEDCAPPPDIILGPVHVVDVEAEAVRRDRALVLSRGRIAADRPAADMAGLKAARPGARVVRGEGRYVLPGLWDMHVHTLWDPSVPPVFMPLFLEHGVTAVRDMGGDLDLALGIRAQIASCALAAPRLWFPGPFLDGPEPVDPALSIALSTPEDGRAGVRLLKEKGVDFIKVYSLVPQDVLEAVANEAASLDMPIVGHLPIGTAPREAARLGFASIEHLAIERGGLCDPDDRAACGAILDTLVAAGVVQVPTLIVREMATAMAYEDGWTNLLDGMPQAVRAYWLQQQETARARVTPDWSAAREASLVHARWMTKALAERGAVILAGSDAGNPFVAPGVSLHQELSLLVEAGLTPAQALRAATVDAARFMGVGDAGVVAEGFWADILLLRKNPLEAIAHTQTIEAVFKGGRQVAGKSSPEEGLGD